MRYRGSPSRRLFLRSATAIFSLPFLESALPRDARGDSTAPKRLVYWFVPNGIQYVPDQLLFENEPKTAQENLWKPAKTGGVQLVNVDSWPMITQSLAPYAAKVNVLAGIQNGAALGSDTGDHARGTGSFLTCREISSDTSIVLNGGISADQVAAPSLSPPTALPSLQLGMEAGGNTGVCNAGYSCAYTRNVAWVDESTPLPNITDPKVAFDRLFPMANSDLTPAQQAIATANRRSVLDSVLAQANTLRGSLGSSDRYKLDEYLSAVNDLETRITAIGGGNCDTPAEPIYGGDLTAQAHIWADLQALAMQCDTTRVITFMLANSGSNRSYDFLGVPFAHHEISHHQYDLVKIAQLQTIDQWEVEQFAYLLGKLDSVADVDGSSILDNTIAYFSSEVQDGNHHTHTDLPIVTAGSCGGKIATGWYRDYANGARQEELSGLYLAMMQAWGLDISSFGYGEDHVLPDFLVDT